MKFVPIIVLFAAQMLSLGVEFAKHGKPKVGTYDAGTSVIALVLSNAFLWWGGWFNVLAQP